jgi:hypothetical protein
MTAVIRFVTHVDVVDAVTDARQMSFSARLEAVLADGRSLTLLDDRGWTTSLPRAGVDGPADIREWISVEEVETDARMVVGPDEPIHGQTYEEAEDGHWASLADMLRHQGVDANAHELEGLPHDVVLSQRLRAWIAGQA